MTGVVNLGDETSTERGHRVKQVEVAVIGTGWCGGIPAETPARSPPVGKPQKRTSAHRWAVSEATQLDNPPCPAFQATLSWP